MLINMRQKTLDPITIACWRNSSAVIDRGLKVSRFSYSSCLASHLLWLDGKSSNGDPYDRTKLTLNNHEFMEKPLVGADPSPFFSSLIGRFDIFSMGLFQFF